MHGSRIRQAAQLTAFVLLGLVAIDLGAPSLCALDQAAVSEFGETSTATAPEDFDTAPPPVHLDDCFCCSHCVHPSQALHPTGLARVEDKAFPLTEQVAFALIAAPFHPPRV